MSKENDDKKHEKYMASYKPNDTFWGIGIENETYLELPNQPKVNGNFFLTCQKRERYSVDYYDTYIDGYFNKTLQSIIYQNEDYILPVLINAHYLTKCDSNGEHSKIYSTNSLSNSKFTGKTNFDIITEADPYFKKEEGNNYCFDGDTIEFMTLNYYKKNIRDVIKELITTKKEFLKRLNAIKPEFCKGETLRYPPQNYGFARMATNLENLAIFNNGTYHFNFTLPTKLDSLGNIANRKSFEFRHKKAIRFIQLMEPFFIAVYGSPDPLTDSQYRLRFPSGSQRCAASRYIGVGMYDTTPKILPSGKLLQEDRLTLQKHWYPFHWYNQLYSQINYKKADKIGFDINFNKFKNHGIELRFFDWFPEDKLEKVLRAIVYLLDIAESAPNMPMNPLECETWHNITYKALLHGKTGVLNMDEIVFIKQYFGIKKINCPSKDIACIFDEIINSLEKQFGTNGPVSKYMLPQKQANPLIRFSTFIASCFGSKSAATPSSTCET